MDRDSAVRYDDNTCVRATSSTLAYFVTLIKFVMYAIMSVAFVVAK